MPASAAPLVVGLGNGCWDTLLDLDQYPAPGGTRRALGRQSLPGGQVAGALVGCIRLGLRARFALRAGDDTAGRRLASALAEAGIDLGPGRLVAGAATARAVILRDATGQRTVFWHTPAALALDPDDITAELFTDAAALFLDGRDGAASLRAAAWARSQGIPVIADLDGVYPHTEELLAAVDHLVAPEEFVAAWMGQGIGIDPKGGDLEAGLRGLAERGPAVAVATRGAAGASAFARGASAMIESPAFPVAVIDATGAGDAFHAAYIAALLEGRPLPARLRFANAAAGLACGARGAQAGLPTRAAVDRLLAARAESGAA